MWHNITCKLVACQSFTVLTCLVFGSALAGLDPPHNASTATGCLSCHQMTSTYPKLLPPLNHTPQDIDDNTGNGVCWSCHNETTAPYVKTHSSLTTDNGYGDWTVECWACHGQHLQEQNRYNGSTYGKFIRRYVNLAHIKGGDGNTLGKTGIKAVRFLGPTGPNSFADGDATADGICEVCHTNTSAWHSDGTLAGVTAHSGLKGSNCLTCHPHDEGFKAVYSCLDCHENALNDRAAVGQQFSGNSHHIQGVPVTSDKCYQCHWEADAAGKLTGYHSATTGAPVDLVIYGAGTRPGTYTPGTTAVAYTADGTRGQILGINSHCLGCHSDQNNATQPFGDGKVPKQYAWDGTSVGAKYADTGTTTWGKYGGSSVSQKLVTKAFSAHGNASANGGGNSVTIANTFVSDESWPNTRANSINIACYDCHNSHGSNVPGTTVSYTSATTNGGLLKNTLSGKGGYTTDYIPISGGSDAARNMYNAGADLCFDCHLSKNAGETPWGYNSTFGASAPVTGFSDYDRFGATDLRKSHAGGHFGASTPLVTGANTPQINGLCTPCHDPHGVSPTLNQAYAVPMLKGTWMTSIYQLDSPPPVTGNLAGGGQYGSWMYPPQYHIDQNTFVPGWNWASTTRISETSDQFGGLCLQCHPKTKIDPDSSTLWRSMDRVHETVNGWGGNARHSFSCSKCHTAHATAKLPRLMVTNCLDSRHKGRLRNNADPLVSGSGEGYREGVLQGSGSGMYPRGGQGTMPGTTAFGQGVSCHSGGGTFPDNNLWNAATPWLDGDNDDSYAYRVNPTSPIRDCDDNDPTIYRAADRTCDGDNDGFIDATAGGTDCNDNSNAIGYAPGTCDLDNDGDIAVAYGGYDCDDNDPAVARAADGTCDNDEDGFIDWTAGGPDCLDNDTDFTSMATDGSCDGDGDGLFDATAGGTDCNDSDANIKEAADTTCDGDADGFIDTSAKANDTGMDCNDNDASVTVAGDNTCDGDNDTYIDATAGGSDCRDTDGTIHNAPDTTCDGDGDGIIDTAAKPTNDAGVDCDDNNAVVKNPTDGNCDNDNDGFIDGTALGSDCNDLNAVVTEATDGTCDGDADGLYDLTAGGTDCDDAVAGIRAAPDATCDGDADGLIDWQAGGPDCLDNDPAHDAAADSTCDGDNDTFIDMSAGGTDCDDGNPLVTATVDGSCDGDGDGFIDSSAGGTDCDDTDNTTGYVAATCDMDGDGFIAGGYGGIDCLDTDASVTWAVDGTCDGDNDTYIDWSAGPGANDCNDNDPAITPTCTITGNSTSYSANTLSDTSAAWPENIFLGRSITYHVTHSYLTGTFPNFIWKVDEHYSTRIITGNTANVITVDSNWDFPTGYTPKDYAIPLE